MRPVSYSQPEQPSAPPMPERSPLEPAATYHRRVAKWRKDNAWRAGQQRAVEMLDKKTTPTVPTIEPGK